MKVAVLSESPADEAAVEVLVAGLLGIETESVALPKPKMRGCKGVLISARPALVHLHYQTDAEALVVTLDSDESPPHQKGHDQPGGADQKCRLCQLRGIVSRVQAQLRPRQGRGPIKTALGLAVPAVEAWYLAGLDPHVTESAWIQALQSGSFPYTKGSLKQSVYGTERPPLAHEETRAVEHTRRLVEESKLDLLEKLFPSGFGALANEVRNW
jgi:hypothetical protein